MCPSEKPDGKDRRLNLRVTSYEKDVLERAAEAERITTSQFVVGEAVTSAEQILADRTRFELPPAEWKAFAERLDEPPRELPAIKELAGEPSPFDE
jgi:uncharacterized protein (DUF1778 family)